MMVRLVLQPNLRDIIGQIIEPAIPEQVAVMERHAIPTGDSWSSVLANIMAVEPTVAMASDRRNHAKRNNLT